MSRALHDEYQNSKEDGEITEYTSNSNSFRFHQLDGDEGYFRRIKEHLQRKLPFSSSDRDHPKNNPTLRSQDDDGICLSACAGIGKVYDDGILCVDKALACDARCYGNFDSASCSNMFAKCATVVCCSCGICISSGD